MATSSKRIRPVADNDKDADILLLGSLTALSACLTKITGIYDKRTIHPNLFTFITARASAGKGRLTLCRNLIDPIRDELRQLNEAEREEYKSKLNELTPRRTRNPLKSQKNRLSVSCSSLQTPPPQPCIRL